MAANNGSGNNGSGSGNGSGGQSGGNQNPRIEGPVRVTKPRR
ncbi:hypothetical protein GCM10023195_79650 [Actinoallomurus liliacearum]|uniref:Uncharacterized protein n=1 Tax=Actinoallomurus liliacearum TaxID=1080073 RepID=A0ABP8TZZ3_9ACTN